MKPLEYYNERKQSSEEKMLQLKKQIATNSIVRLLLFILVFVVFFGLLKVQSLIAIVGAIALVVIFLLLVKRHLKLSRDKNYYEKIYQITSTEIDALSNDFRELKKGDEYINPGHSYSYDLDLFGKGSLFEMLNRTITDRGERKLVNRITTEPENAKEVYLLQDATRELANMPDFMLSFRAIGKMSGLVKEDLEQINKWKHNTSFVQGRRGLRVLSFLLPLFFFTTLVFTIINPALSSLLVTVFIFNIGFVGLNFRKINNEHNRVSVLLKMLQKYQNLLVEVENSNFNSELFKVSKEQLQTENIKASEQLRRLTKLVGAFDSRLNFVAAIFLQGILLWDYHCLFKIERWRVENGKRLANWIDEIAFFDSMISGGIFAFNYPGYKYPVISASKILEGKETGHPLIPSSSRVSNNFEIYKKGDFVIVTGANMAGKSTFLRTIGVNLVLAKSGLPVCAELFEFSLCKLFTSMRTSDSLSENESYFYAELKRLKSVMDKLEKGEELFIILDEILKGTNSVDKQKGSRHALEKILKLGGTGIIATHDLALTEIIEDYPERVKNQCFEIEINNAKIKFDYKLYNGVTKKMNAMLLMEQMGIV